MSNYTMNGYALFVNNIFKTIMYYPSEGSWKAVKITAALKNNPTILLDEPNSIDSVHKYSIIVEGDYVDHILIPKQNDVFDLSILHNALQNNPTVVWIDSDTVPHSSSKWSYENNVLTQVED